MFCYLFVNEKRKILQLDSATAEMCCIEFFSYQSAWSITRRGCEFLGQGFAPRSLRKCSSESPWLCPIYLYSSYSFFFINYEFVNSLKIVHICYCGSWVSGTNVLYLTVIASNPTSTYRVGRHLSSKLTHIAFEDLVFTVLLLERYAFVVQSLAHFWELRAILACLRPNYKFWVQSTDQHETDDL